MILFLFLNTSKIAVHRAGLPQKLLIHLNFIQLLFLIKHDMSAVSVNSVQFCLYLMQTELKKESPYHCKDTQFSHTDLLPILNSMQKKPRCSTQIIVLDDFESELHRNQEKLQITNKEPLSKIKLKKQEEPNHANAMHNEGITQHQSTKMELDIKPKLGKCKVRKIPKYQRQVTGEQKWTRLRKRTNPWYTSQVEECTKLQSFLISHNYSKVSNTKIYSELRRLRNSKYTAN